MKLSLPGTDTLVKYFLAIALPAAVVLGFRLHDGYDGVTGEDLTTSMATQLNPDLEIRKVAYSTLIRSVSDRRSGAQGYFLFRRSEDQLTGPLRMAPCDGLLPRWIPVYPEARSVVCTLAGTNHGERRFASFLVAAADLKATSDFYTAALEGLLGAGAHGLSNLPGADFRGGYSHWSHSVSGRRVEIEYFTGDWNFSARSLPIVVISFDEPIAANPQSLTAIFDAYNSAIALAQSGQIEPVLALRTGEFRERETTLEAMRASLPLRYSVESQVIDAERAALALQADLNIDRPGDPQHGQTLRQTMWVDFEFEKGAWKIAGVTLAPDQSRLKRSPDAALDGNKSNYDGANRVSLKGRIVGVAFETSHTLLKLQVQDEEYLIFMIERAGLEAAGIDAAKLMPPRLIEVQGHQHLTHRLKIAGTLTQRGAEQLRR